MFRIYRTLLVASFLVAPLALAASDSEAETSEDAITIQTATCEDVYNLFSDATPEEDKDPAQLEQAQDDVLYFVIWVHGYLSGRDGIDPEKRPLSKEGIEKTIADMDVVCKPDESKKFLDVIGDIK